MRRMGPLKDDHPLVRDCEDCPGCKQPFKAGEYVTLVTIGPADDEEQQQLARDGKAYNAVAVAAHWTCVTGKIDE